MAFDLASISKGKRLRAPRIVLTGTEKSGKSTFAAQSDSPIFLPIKGEEGIDDIDVAHFPTCQTFGDVLEALTTLYSEKHDFQTVVIDSTSTLETLVFDETCRRHGAKSIEQVGGGFGKGYTEALRPWREITEGLDALRAEKNMACILIGHVTVKSFNDPTADSYDQYTWDIHQKASNALVRWADSILFINRRTIVKREDVGFNKTKSRAVGEDQRFLYTQKRPAHPGGGRGVYGRLPYEIPLSWPAFMAAVEAASQQPT